MKILVACTFPDAALNKLRSLGATVEYEPALRPNELSERVADVSILVVNQLAVTAEAIDRGNVLQLIVCARPGGGQVAVDAAAAQGVIVAHCPDQDAIACSELILGLMLALDRHLVENANRVREGQWHRHRFSDAYGITGRVIGMITTAAICRALAPRTKALGLKPLAWMPDVDNAFGRNECGIELCNWPRELARRSDIIVLHGPLPPAGDRIIDQDFLESMQEGTTLIHLNDHNTLDEGALIAAIEQKRLRVAVDVNPGEGLGETGRLRSKLLQMPGVLGAHHMTGATAQARDAIAAEVVRIISAFLISGELVNPLNISERSPATWQLVLRLRDQVGVMAAVLAAIRADGINAEEVTSRVFVGAKAAWCTISLDERPSTEALAAIRDLDDVLHLDLRAVV